MDDAFAAFLHVGESATNSLKGTLDSITPRKLLRVVIVLGGYMLLRRFLLVYAAKRQRNIMEDEDEASRAKLTPSQLRGGQRYAPIPGDTSDEDEGEDGNGDGGDGVTATAAVTASDWGKKARRRQRRVLRQLVNAEEKRLRAQFGEEDDKDIEEFLEKDPPK